jgi:O-antigen/teichoic acid export membrane protein
MLTSLEFKMKKRGLAISNYLFSLINKGNDRSIKAKKNIIIAFLVKGGSIVISLFLVPITIHYVSPSQYGIWVTLSSIIGWFSFFDIGFGNGLRNKFAESVAKGEHELARIYVSTTYAILTIIIAIVLLLFIFINPFLNWSKILNANSNMAGELSTLALIVFVFFCLQFVLQLITTVLTADQQPAKASLFNFFGSLLSGIIIFILTKTTAGNLIYLGTAYSLTPIVILSISSIWFYSKKYKKYAPSFKYVRFRYSRNLMTLGLKFFLLQIAGLVLYQTSNIIIAQLFGAAEVTPYNIAFKYFNVIPMVLGIILLPFWSAYTEAWLKNDIGWIKSTLKKLKMFWLLLTILTLIMLIFSPYIYAMWVGKEIVVPFSLSAVIGAYVIINAWNGIYCAFLNGIGKIQLQLYTGILDMIIHIPLAIYLGKKIGIAGVILSLVILCGLNMIWTIIQYNKIINNKAKGIWAK